MPEQFYYLGRPFLFRGLMRGSPGRVSRVHVGTAVQKKEGPGKPEALPVTWPGVLLALVSLGRGVWVSSVAGAVLFVVGYVWLGRGEPWST